MTKKKIVLWVCDYSDLTGEGTLARKFIKEFFTQKKIKIETLKVNNFFNQKYLIPIIGIFYCWKNYLNGKKVGYINYLPLWNFIIFIFLPPQTILGPITGGAKYIRSFNINYFIRKFLFPVFYKISESFIKIRNPNNIIFSTELLKEYLSKEISKKSKFNYILNNFKFFLKKKKKIDFLIYHRLHRNKSTFFDYRLINNLIKSNLKVYVVGDELKIEGVKNFGYISKKKILNLQSYSKYTLCSKENIYSLFILECISNHVKIIIDKKLMKKVKFLKKYFISLKEINLQKTSK